MNILILILWIAVVFMILLFIFAVKVKLVFDTEKSDLVITLLWLEPVIKAFLTIENTKPVLKILLFNKVVFDRKIERGKNKHRLTDLIKLSNISDIYVSVKYGFRDPFNTGIICGALSSASQLINIDQISNNPDFTADDDYIYLDATAKVNIGHAMVRYLRHKTNS